MADESNADDLGDDIGAEVSTGKKSGIKGAFPQLLKFILIGVAAVILISQLINENRILQYFGRISLIILCIHGPVYRIVVKIVSILLNVGTDAVSENFLLAMVVVFITMAICSMAYEVVVRLAPWMLGKKRVHIGVRNHKEKINISKEFINKTKER